MDKLPKITIATVVYNGIKEIENTIQSVINQYYPSLEYIIIDGNSSDGTIEVIKKYDNRISYWLSEPDQGIYYAMNKAIEKSTGEWILFMNCGDYFYSQRAISNIFHETSNYDDFAVVYGDAEFRLKKFSYIVEASDSDSNRFMPFSHQAAFTRTDLAKQEMFDTSYRISADSEFFLRLIRKGYIFKHVSSIVCSYDAYIGLSVSNETARATELVDMQIKHGASYTDYYDSFIKDAKRKEKLRKLLPSFIWHYLRLRKIKKQYKL